MKPPNNGAERAERIRMLFGFGHYTRNKPAFCHQLLRPFTNPKCELWAGWWILTGRYRNSITVAATHLFNVRLHVILVGLNAP